MTTVVMRFWGGVACATPTERAGTKQLSEVKGFDSTTACTNGATPGGIDAPLTMNIPLALHKAASCAPTQFA
jgi:hypothetical protein